MSAPSTSSACLQVVVLQESLLRRQDAPSLVLRFLESPPSAETTLSDSRAHGDLRCAQAATKVSVSVDKLNLGFHGLPDEVRFSFQRPRRAKGCLRRRLPRTAVPLTNSDGRIRLRRVMLDGSTTAAERRAKAEKQAEPYEQNAELHVFANSNASDTAAKEFVRSVKFVAQIRKQQFSCGIQFISLPRLSCK